MMKFPFLPIVLLICFTFSATAQSPGMKQQATASLYYNSENLRSDTFDVLKYTIRLDVGDISTQLLSGHTVIRFAPKLNNRTFIRFDLLRLTIDSVKEGASHLTYTYNDTIVRINFLSPKNTTDTSEVTVFYHGVPQKDAMWGGFFFDNTQGAEYAYNMGVGFSAKPHNYGRVWFPCFDNFVERSRYEFVITNDSSRRSYCNGSLTQDIVNGALRTRTWVLNEQIPSYLACIAVAKYTQLNWPVNTLSGVKPVILAATPADTNALKAAFVNLKACIQAFESYYGPYRWPRFGYVLVPFPSGAMEHATNITYPRAFIGNTAYEADLMAHELAHHWWGDLVTCETPEDMWINEGLASYSSNLFLEWVYGKKAYMDAVKTTHDDLLHFLFKKEGFRAVSGVPHDLTYGSHVYRKGSDLAHTLRGYMGDTAFFKGIRHTMQQKAFTHLNSDDLKNSLQAGSGVNVASFFKDWVFSPGWSHFAIDSVRMQPNTSGASATVSVSQKLFGATQLHSNVPLEVTFFNSSWGRATFTVSFTGAHQVFSFSVPFVPVLTSLNLEGKINDATSHETRTLKSSSTVNFNIAKARVTFQQAGGDSSLVRVIHHYVKPDAFKNNPSGSRLSDQQYWTVEGIFSAGFSGRIRFNYDGNKNTAGVYSYLDTMLLQTNGDSLALFYRRDAGNEWQWLQNASRTKTGTRTGYFETDQLLQGQYTFANLGDSAALLGIRSLSPDESFRIYPNPAGNEVSISVEWNPNRKSEVLLMDMGGRVIRREQIRSALTTINTKDQARGAYTVCILSNGAQVLSRKLILE